MCKYYVGTVTWKCDLKAKLSAVLQCLEQIRFEKKEKRRNVLRDLCVSGYPDIQPWQVRSACLSQVDSNETNDHCSDSIMEYLYYTYLCHLLNPVDGHEGARQDLDLLKEFCEWSVGVKPKEETNPTRMENFLSIAASSSSHHKKYRRDLIMLMDLSLAINNHELALTLGTFRCFTFSFRWTICAGHLVYPVVLT